MPEPIDLDALIAAMPPEERDKLARSALSAWGANRMLFEEDCDAKQMMLEELRLAMPGELLDAEQGLDDIDLSNQWRARLGYLLVNEYNHELFPPGANYSGAPFPCPKSDWDILENQENHHGS